MVVGLEQEPAGGVVIWGEGLWSWTIPLLVAAPAGGTCETLTKSVNLAAAESQLENQGNN